MTPTTAPAPCARCPALEDWSIKALRLFERIRDEWPDRPTWLDRQIERAKAQCPVQPPGQEAPRA